MKRLDKNNPCKPDCPNRTVSPNCHMTCKKHLNWLEAREAEKQKIAEYNTKNGIKNTKLCTEKSVKIWQQYHLKRKDGY